MKIRVLFFGSLAHDVGRSSHELELSDNATVAHALDVLEDVFEAIKPHRTHLATAVNHEYVGAGQGLKDGDELALIPPVSGG